jgi:hypothetical protein
MRMSSEAYNPLEKRHLGESIASALLSEPLQPLPPVRQFPGAGVYVIYYRGPHHAYSPVTALDKYGEFIRPIYVGKSVPAGARKGGIGTSPTSGSELYGRLKEHAKDISSTTTLSLADFQCRWLVVDDIFIPLGESLMIERYKPVWNVVIDGFGNHNPGKGRYRQECSAWDVLHPGRKWASQCRPYHKSESELLAAIAKHFQPKLLP